MEQKNSPLLLILGGLAIASVTVAVCAGISRHQPAQAQAAEPELSFRIGDILRLRESGSPPLFASPVIGATEERLFRARDRKGLNELYEAELVYYAEAGCRVRLLGFDAYPEESRRLGCSLEWVQVRIVGGRDDGRAGWMAACDLERQK